MQNNQKWLLAAKSLEVNDKCRIDCDCGSGRTMIVNNNIKSYSAYCFRCSYKAYQYKDSIGLFEDYKPMETKKTIIELPKDTEPLVSAIGYNASIARKIMYRSQIFEDLWSKFNIGYSDSLRRLVLPVYDSQGVLVWYQLRSTEKNAIKYMQPSADKNVCFYAPNNNVADSVVIVEDILSAIKVSTVSSVIALLGTKLNTYSLSKISNFSEAIIWLDGDTAGINGSYEVYKSTSLLCSKVRRVVTTLDPKKYNSQEIRKIIWTN